MVRFDIEQEYMEAREVEFKAHSSFPDLTKLLEEVKEDYLQYKENKDKRIDDLTKDLHELQKEIDAKRLQNDKIYHENSNLLAEKADMLRRLSHLELEKQSYLERMTTIEVELTQHQQNSQILTETVQRKYHILEETVKEQEDFISQQREESTTQKQAFHRELESLNHERQDLSRQLSHLKNESESFKKAAIEAEARLDQERISLGLQNDDLLKELRNENTKLETKISELNAQLASTQEDVASLHRAEEEWKRAKEEYENRIKEAQESQQIGTLFEQEKADKEKLQEQLVQAEEKLRSVEELRRGEIDKLSELETRCSTLQEEINSAKDRLRDEKEESERLKGQLDKANLKGNDAEIQTSDLAETSEKISALELELQRSGELNSSLTEMVRTLEEQLRRTNTKEEKDSVLVERLQDYAQVKELLAKKTKELEEIKHDLNDRDGALIELSNLRMRCEALSAENESLEEKISELSKRDERKGSVSVEVAAAKGFDERYQKLIEENELLKEKYASDIETLSKQLQILTREGKAASLPNLDIAKTENLNDEAKAIEQPKRTGLLGGWASIFLTENELKKL